MVERAAWYFESDLLWRDDLKRTLDMVSLRPWTMWDSDSRPDSIINNITDHGWLKIYEFGRGAFVANLTAEGETKEELAINFEIAKQKTFDEIFAAVGARDIKATELVER